MHTMNTTLIDNEILSTLRKSLSHNKDYRPYEVIRLVKYAANEVFHKKVRELKENLKEAFAEIRKEKKVCIRQGFSCCGSCGSYELSELCKKTGKKGYMFYSRQSKYSIDKYGEVYFNYEYGTDDECKSFMHYVVNVLNRHGVKTVWDGNIGTALKVSV